MKFYRHNMRAWIFLLLTVVGCWLMVTSFAMPWWHAATIEVQMSGAIQNPFTIYGYGLRQNMGQLSKYIENDITPVYQTILAWAYVAISTLLLFISVKLKKIKGILLMGIVGVVYISYVSVAGFVVIARRLNDWGFALQGDSAAAIQGSLVTIHAGFDIGFTLAYCAGVYFILLALARLAIKDHHK